MPSLGTILEALWLKLGIGRRPAPLYLTNGGRVRVRVWDGHDPVLIVFPGQTIRIPGARGLQITSELGELLVLTLSGTAPTKKAACF